jgi:hypothetical protein
MGQTALGKGSRRELTRFICMEVSEERDLIKQLVNCMVTQNCRDKLPLTELRSQKVVSEQRMANKKYSY